MSTMIFPQPRHNGITGGGGRYPVPCVWRIDAIEAPGSVVITPTLPPPTDTIMTNHMLICHNGIMGLSLKERCLKLTTGERHMFLNSLGREELEGILADNWWWSARPEQLQPDGDFMIWLILAGRGWGKTRTATEWIVQRSIDHPIDASGAPTERLLVGETIADVRNILIGGPSGVLRVLERKKIRHRYYKSPKPKIVLLDTGAVIHGVGAENGDVGRGLNLADVVMDEYAKWPFPVESWFEGIMPALRVHIPDDHPRALVTTTPKPLEILRTWRDETDGSVAVVSGSTFDNSANLSAQVLDGLRKNYAGTKLGEQELHGLILDDFTGKLFSQQDLNLARVRSAPELVEVVVGVDPCLTGEEDEMGVVVVGRDEHHDWYVLADATAPLVGKAAARHCWNVFFEYEATRLVVEENLGKRWMVETFTDAYIDTLKERGTPIDMVVGAPIVGVQSMVGKKLRAQIVGHRSEQRRLHMVGIHNKLEIQAVGYDPDTSKDSPDRLDAMVHACRYHHSKEPISYAITAPPTGFKIDRRLHLDGLDQQKMPWE
jgi:phage terminase large subunit-like protein